MYWKRFERRKPSLLNRAVLSQNTPGDAVKTHENHSTAHFKVTLQIVRILIHCNATQTELCPCLHHVLTESAFFICITTCICLPSDGQWLKYISATYETRVLSSRCFQYFSFICLQCVQTRQAITTPGSALSTGFKNAKKKWLSYLMTKRASISWVTGNWTKLSGFQTWCYYSDSIVV